MNYEIYIELFFIFHHFPQRSQQPFQYILVSKDNVCRTFQLTRNRQLFAVVGLHAVRQSYFYYIHSLFRWSRRDTCNLPFYIAKLLVGIIIQTYMHPLSHMYPNPAKEVEPYLTPLNCRMAES